MLRIGKSFAEVAAGEVAAGAAVANLLHNLGIGGCAKCSKQGCGNASACELKASHRAHSKMLCKFN